MSSFSFVTLFVVIVDFKVKDEESCVTMLFVPFNVTIISKELTSLKNQYP